MPSFEAIDAQVVRHASDEPEADRRVVEHAAGEVEQLHVAEAQMPHGLDDQPEERAVGEKADHGAAGERGHQPRARPAQPAPPVSLHGDPDAPGEEAGPDDEAEELHRDLAG